MLGEMNHVETLFSRMTCGESCPLINIVERRRVAKRWRSMVLSRILHCKQHDSVQETEEQSVVAKSKVPVVSPTAGILGALLLKTDSIAVLLHHSERSSPSQASLATGASVVPQSCLFARCSPISYLYSLELLAALINTKKHKVIPLSENHRLRIKSCQPSPVLSFQSRTRLYQTLVLSFPVSFPVYIRSFDL